MYFKQTDDSPGYFPFQQGQAALARDTFAGLLCSLFTSTLLSGFTYTSKFALTVCTRKTLLYLNLCFTTVGAQYKTAYRVDIRMFV
jgi:hypothetical protein